MARALKKEMTINVTTLEAVSSVSQLSHQVFLYECGFQRRVCGVDEATVTCGVTDKLSPQDEEISLRLVSRRRQTVRVLPNVEITTTATLDARRHVRWVMLQR